MRAGIAGIGGVRGGGLPATLSVVDTHAGYPSTNPAGPASAQPAAQPQQYGQYGNQYGSGQYGGSGGHPQSEQQQRPISLPDTLTVTSIIDEPPVQRPAYGSFPAQAQQQQQAGEFGGGGGEYGCAAPRQPDPAWEVHYHNGSPYYYNRATGQTQWTPP